ncbi:MAG TPA: hypothetical protein VK453_14930 [Micromonosporaceae bacterium]|nr:hypothetical protein [Micromonosporaceae bacterium]
MTRATLHLRGRRAVLLGVVAALLTAACSAHGSADVTPTQTPVPGGSGPVASWELTGGYSAAGVLTLRPRRLVVYPNGEAVADAAYRTDLAAADVAELVGALADDLSAPVTDRRTGLPSVLDAPTTVLTVRSTTGSYTARTEGLDELREERGYPDQLYDARDRLSALHKRIVAAGQPYTAERVRVVAEPVGSAPPGDDGSALPSADAARPWPAALPVPDRQGTDTARIADLDGDRARDAVRLLERDLDLNGAWRTYRTGDGTLLRASWRYLLRDE